MIKKFGLSLLALTGIVLLCKGMLNLINPVPANAFHIESSLILAHLGLFALIALLLLYKFRNFGNLNKFLTNNLQICEFDLNTKLNALQLFFISFLVLYFELLIIRWLSTEIRYFAYFKNFPLISAFIGLGIGCAVAKRKYYLFPYFPFLIGIFSLMTLYVGHNISDLFVNISFGENAIWTIMKPQHMFQIFRFYAYFLFLFFFNMFNFICLGQLMGRLMLPFKPLTAYSINIFGSLVGILAFSIISFFSLAPFYWFLIGFIFILWFLRNNIKVVMASIILFVAVLGIIQAFHIREKAIWSPYYKITISKHHLPLTNDPAKNPFWGYSVAVNKDGHQWPMNLSSSFTSKYPEAFPNPRYGLYKYTATYYDLPYRVINPKNVLIVGGGSGNDAAAAVRNGIKDIDVVEIDPEILRIGKKLHPERPYDSPYVHLINDDARSYFKKSKKKYDLIVFGFLDSLTLFSSMSSVRLDNFVYTKESFEEVKNRLTDKGMVFFSFALIKTNLWIGPRMAKMLTHAFKKEPITLFNGRASFIGPVVDEKSFDHDPILKDILTKHRTHFKQEAMLITDNWPFLYLKEKKIPANYLVAVFLISLIFFFIIKPAILKKTVINYHFFFLGSAFLLIETKSVLELALLFGSTWIVNSFVFGSILIMILFANLLITKLRNISLPFCYLCLLASLLINFFVPFNAILNHNIILRTIIACMIISLPLFFAAMIFATSFKKCKNIDLAFGSNLLGAFVGGFSEYASLLFGIKSLSLLAIVFYFLSYFFYKDK